MRCLYHELRLKSPETNLKSEILILCQILGNTSGNGNLIKTNSIMLIVKTGGSISYITTSFVLSSTLETRTSI